MNLGRRLLEWLWLSLRCFKFLLRPNLTPAFVCEAHSNAYVEYFSFGIWLVKKLVTNTFPKYIEIWNLWYAKHWHRMCLEKKKIWMVWYTCHHLLNIESYFKFEKNHWSVRLTNIAVIFVNMMELRKHAFWDIGWCQKINNPLWPGLHLPISSSVLKVLQKVVKVPTKCYKRLSKYLEFSYQYRPYKSSSKPRTNYGLELAFGNPNDINT